MSLVVTTPALTTALTTLATVKSELLITETTEDEYLQRQIDSASALICAYLCVPLADDGTVTLGREVLLETATAFNGEFRTARNPIFAVASVTDDGGTLIDPTDYTFGYARIKSADESWTNSSFEVAYTAGWLLPNDTGRNLPVEIEDACIAMVKAARFARSRDTSLRSENILEGLYSYTLFDPEKMSFAIAPDVAAKIDRYRNVFV